MKTQIIRLEVHDDTISVRDKMDWSQAPRVLLVWPEKGNVLQSRLDLVLLERFCTSHGSQLALVSADPEVIFHAGEVGIPVFQSRGIAQIQPWRKSFREFNRREIVGKASSGREVDLDNQPLKPPPPELPPWTRISIFSTALLGVLAVLGMLLPSAVIILPEEITSHNLEIPVDASRVENQVNLSGTIPVKEIQITVQGEVRVAATGSVSIPAEKARGEVLFKNLGDDPVEIPEGTVLSTSGEEPIQFLTLETGRLSDGIGEEILIPVIALTPGEIGNLEAGEISTIGGSLGAILSATNPEPTAGGIDIMVQAPNASDYRQAQRLLSASLNQAARAELADLLDQADILLNPDLDAAMDLEEDRRPEEGAPGSELTLRKEVMYTAAYAAREDLEQLAEGLVLAQYQGDQIEPILDSIEIAQLSEPEENIHQSFTWEAAISWQDKKAADPDQIIQIALGKDPDQAISLIQEEYDFEIAPQIILDPGWWFRIPFLPFRIEITAGGS